MSEVQMHEAHTQPKLSWLPDERAPSHSPRQFAACNGLILRLTIGMRNRDGDTENGVFLGDTEYGVFLEFQVLARDETTGSPSIFWLDLCEPHVYETRGKRGGSSSIGQPGPSRDAEIEEMVRKMKAHADMLAALGYAGPKFSLEAKGR